jgi:hypothetical protein
VSRAGREPAEDVKRRLVAACQEVGLTVTSARMHMLPGSAARVVHVQGNVDGWPHETTPLSVLACVKESGDWPESIDIRCVGSEEDPMRLTGPWMRGRSEVPFGELVEQLQETLKERQMVIAAAKSGVARPYKFERAVWEEVDLFRNL